MWTGAFITQMEEICADEDDMDKEAFQNLVAIKADDRISYNAYNRTIQLTAMFGYIVNKGGSIQVLNRIFETCLYNLFLSEEELTNAIYNQAQANQQQFLCSGKLDMDMVLKKFVDYFTEIWQQ